MGKHSSFNTEPVFSFTERPPKERVGHGNSFAFKLMSMATILSRFNSAVSSLVLPNGSRVSPFAILLYSIISLWRLSALIPINLASPATEFAFLDPK